MLRLRRRALAVGQPVGMTAPRPEPHGPGPAGRQVDRRRSLLAFVIAVVAGALLWAAWLGWDRTASFDVVTGTVQYPYVTLQVLGCALSVGVVVAAFAARLRPVTGAAGVAVGFWLVWTVDAASKDETGLFGVGALLLAAGLALGTTVAAAVGVGVGAVVRSARRRGER